MMANDDDDVGHKHRLLKYSLLIQILNSNSIILNSNSIIIRNILLQNTL